MARPRPNTLRARTPIVRSGYSLFELVAVLLILSVLSATAIPMVSSMTSLQTHSVRATLVASLAFAQANAAATGSPTGLRIVIADQTYQLIKPLDSGFGVEPITDPFGQPDRARPLSRADRQVVTGVTGTGVSSTQPTVWFGFQGVPERRNAAGMLFADAYDVTVINLEQGQSIQIHPITGMIE